jgi:hypothetical protein
MTDHRPMTIHLPPSITTKEAADRLARGMLKLQTQMGVATQQAGQSMANSIRAFGAALNTGMPLEWADDPLPDDPAWMYR